MSKRKKNQAAYQQQQQQQAPPSSPPSEKANADPDLPRGRKRKRRRKKSHDINTKNKEGVGGDDDKKGASSVTRNGDGGGDGGIEQWSKSKKKRMRAMKAQQRRKDDGGAVDCDDAKEADGGVTADDGSDNAGAAAAATTTSPPPPPSSSALQNSFKARLSGSRFRTLNEDLYTTTSASSFRRFSEDPELYKHYHDGFRRQVEQWPVNPVDVVVRSLRKLPQRIRGGSSAGEGMRKIVVADFGCGDAALAKQLLAVTEKDGRCPFDVRSFDLVAACPLVTACDMANVPLENESADVGIFCLSLMGTNLADFIREAHRVLKRDGVLKIAEVRSRFESGTKNTNNVGGGGDISDGRNSRKNKGGSELADFVRVLQQLGFECTKIDRSNKMFLLLDLKKNGKSPKKDLKYTAKPCIYKRR